jgi:MFS family permease
VGRVGSGWLCDKYNLKNVSVIFYVVFALGMVCFIYTSSESFWIIIPAVILYGLGWGGIFTVRGPLALDYFGRKNYGSIFGWLMGMITIGGIIGPLFAGWVYDTYASYRIAWIIYAVITFISIIILASTPRIARTEGPGK